jgi:hypothetical protein
VAKKSQADLEKLFKDSFEEQLGDRKTGWKIEDSEPVVLKLLNGQTDKTGKDIKLPADTLEKVKIAMLVTPARIVPFIVEEMAKAGATVDELTKAFISKLLDVQGFRQSLVAEDILEKAPKGKKKASITSLLK